MATQLKFVLCSGYNKDGFFSYKHGYTFDLDKDDAEDLAEQIKNMVLEDIEVMSAEVLAMEGEDDG